MNAILRDIEIVLFRRGNPLYLCEDSYKKLKEIWLKHMMYEVVVNSMEKHPTLMDIPWAHT